MLPGIELLYAEQQMGPALGQPVAETELGDWKISVFPDGTGLPEGSGSVLQGEALYTQQCQSCHGPLGQGASADQLAGSNLSLTGPWPEKILGNYWPYATTLFDFTRRSMPMQTPGSLSDNDVYALTAYMLFLNGIVEKQTVLDADTLAEIKMPNRDGFIDVYQQGRNAKE